MKFELTNEEINENKILFTTLFKENIKREGSEKLLEYILNSDFFEAPASSKYHLNIEGGLCLHSLNVFNNINRDKLKKYSNETIAIITLLHDLCKINFYEKYSRNIKVDNKWVQSEEYRINELLPYGHGEKSVFIIQKFMKLSTEEALAIRFHMGIKDNDYGESSKAFTMTPLLLYLYISDLESTFYYENENIKDKK